MNAEMRMPLLGQERGIQVLQQQDTSPPSIAPGGDDCKAEESEHRGDRRRFLIWALMLGAVTPQRVVDRVLAELKQECRVRNECW